MYCYTVTWRLQDKLKARSLLGCCAVRIGSEQQSFGTACFILRGQEFPCLTLEDGTDRLSRNVGN